MSKKLFVSFLLLTFFYFAKGQNGTVGEKVYKTKCLVCHQADGGGVPNLNAPLDGSTNVVGNAVATVVISKWEGELHEHKVNPDIDKVKLD